MIRLVLRVCAVLMVGCIGTLIITLSVANRLPSEAYPIFTSPLNREIFVLDVARNIRAELFGNLPIRSDYYVPRKLSENGQRIALEFIEQGVRSAAIFDFRGNTLYRTSPSVEDGVPIISPDGQYVAFWSTRMTPDLDTRRWKNWHLYILNLSTQTVNQVSPEATSAPSENLLWSPNSKSLYFMYWDVNERITQVYDIESAILSTFTQAIPTGIEHTWSPDSQYIAFTSSVSQIFALRVGTGEITFVSGLGTRDSRPTWSPDSSQIAFASNRDGVSNIYVRDWGGEGAVQVTSGGGFNPVWSPHSDQILFNNNRGLNFYDVLFLKTGVTVQVNTGEPVSFLGWYMPAN